MPIEFPQPNRGPEWALPENIITNILDTELQVDVTNLDGVGAAFTQDMLDPGFGQNFNLPTPVNLRHLGFDFEGPEFQDRINVVAPDAHIAQVDMTAYTINFSWAGVNRAITGVSRDSGGSAIGSVSLSLFVTSTNMLVAQTTSDASGNFSFGNPGTGPFYIVAYKVGAPDVAGTTVNTLAPALV